MALDCNTNPNYSGRALIVEFAFACGDVDPQGGTLSYLPVGSTNQKDLEVGTTTSGNTTDDTLGVESNIVTYLTFEVTAAGFATQTDSIKSNQAALKKYLVNEVTANPPRQPVAWVRVIAPDVTYFAYCNVTSTAMSGASTDTTTFTVTFSATGTGTDTAPVQVIDTP